MITNVDVTCPWCAKPNDSVSSLGDPNNVPTPGDITMCIGCGGWAIFSNDLSLQKPTEEEWAGISILPEVQEASLYWANIIQSSSQKPN